MIFHLSQNLRIHRISPDEVGGPTCTMERCMVAGFTEGPPPRNLRNKERVATCFANPPFWCRGNPGFCSKQMGKCCQGKKTFFSPWILRNLHDVELWFVGVDLVITWIFTVCTSVQKKYPLVWGAFLNHFPYPKHPQFWFCRYSNEIWTDIAKKWDCQTCFLDIQNPWVTSGPWGLQISSQKVIAMQDRSKGCWDLIGGSVWQVIYPQIASWCYSKISLTFQLLRNERQTRDEHTPLVPNCHLWFFWDKKTFQQGFVSKAVQTSTMFTDMFGMTAWKRMKAR